MSGWKQSLKDLFSGVISDFLYDFAKYAIPAGFLAALLEYTKKLFPLLEGLPTKVILLGFGLLAIFVFLFKRYWTLNKSRVELLKNSGLFYFGRNTREEDKSKNVELLLEKIKSAKGIEMIGATGYNTFARCEDPGGKKAILREAFESYVTGEIKILLLNPNAKQTRMRAAALGVPLDKYQREIFDSIDFLKDLKNKGKTIALKLYSQRPIWKMIILDDFLWLQYYDSRYHVEQMPVYGISRRKDGSNLFDPLYEVFKKKWNHDYNPTYDFETNELVYPPGEEGEQGKRVKLERKIS